MTPFTFYDMSEFVKIMVGVLFFYMYLASRFGDFEDLLSILELMTVIVVAMILFELMRTYMGLRYRNLELVSRAAAHRYHCTHYTLEPQEPPAAAAAPEPPVAAQVASYELHDTSKDMVESLCDLMDGVGTFLVKCNAVAATEGIAVEVEDVTTEELTEPIQDAPEVAPEASHEISSE